MMGIYQPGPVNKNKSKPIPNKVIGEVSKTPGTQIPPAKPLTKAQQAKSLHSKSRNSSVSGQNRNPYEKKQVGGILKNNPNVTSAMVNYMRKPKDTNTQTITATPALGDKMHDAISDAGTGVATWGTSFRRPTQNELQQGRGNWGERTKLISGAITQGLANELVGGVIGKVAGRLVTKSVTKSVPKSSTIDTGSSMWNKGQILDELVSKIPEDYRREIRGQMVNLSKEEFAKEAKKAGYIDFGHHWGVSSSGLSPLYENTNIVRGLLKDSAPITEDVAANSISAYRRIDNKNVNSIIKDMQPSNEGAFTHGITKGDDYVYIHKRAGQHNPKIPKLTSELSKEFPEITPTHQSVVGDFGNVQLQGKATGTVMHRVPEADLNKLTQAQIDNAKKAVSESSKRGLEFDFVNDKGGNTIYDPEKGFKFIDFDTKYPDVSNAVEGFRRQVKGGIEKITDMPADAWLKNKGLILSIIPALAMAKLNKK